MQCFEVIVIVYVLKNIKIKYFSTENCENNKAYKMW